MLLDGGTRQLMAIFHILTIGKFTVGITNRLHLKKIKYQIGSCRLFRCRAGVYLIDFRTIQFPIKDLQSIFPINHQSFEANV